MKPQKKKNKKKKIRKEVTMSLAVAIRLVSLQWMLTFKDQEAKFSLADMLPSSSFGSSLNPTLWCIAVFIQTDSHLLRHYVIASLQLSALQVDTEVIKYLISN